MFLAGLNSDIGNLLSQVSVCFSCSATFDRITEINFNLVDEGVSPNYFSILFLFFLYSVFFIIIINCSTLLLRFGFFLFWVIISPCFCVCFLFVDAFLASVLTVVITLPASVLSQTSSAIFETRTKERIRPFEDPEEEEDIWEDKEINYATQVKARSRFVKHTRTLTHSHSKHSLL